MVISQASREKIAQEIAKYPRPRGALLPALHIVHAEHGYLGAPIAKYAMETYFAKKEGRPLPTLEKPAAPVIVAANSPTATGRQNR